MKLFSANCAGLALGLSLSLVGCQGAVAAVPQASPRAPEPSGPVVEFYEGETTVFAPNGERIVSGRVFLKRTINSQASEVREEVLLEDTFAELADFNQLRAGVHTFLLHGSSVTVVDNADRVQGSGQMGAGRMSITTHDTQGSSSELLREQTSRGFFTRSQSFDARGATVSRSEGMLHRISPERFTRQTERLEPPES